MRIPPTKERNALLLLVCTILSAQFAQAQFVDLKTALEVNVWHPEGVSTRTMEIHCVVGTNSWQMDGDFMANGRVTYLFNGKNLIEHTVITSGPSEELMKRLNQPGSVFGRPPPIGQHITNVIESVDGNPGQTVGQGDQLTMPARIAWLAYCSGPALKREGRAIFPPDDLWKEMISATSFKDITTVFDDPLGLPKTIDLISPKNQQVMQYRVVTSTNILGWEFPLEFYLAQYQPARVPGKNWLIARTNGWELDFVAKGTIKTIQETPEAPSSASRSDMATPPHK